MFAIYEKGKEAPNVQGYFRLIDNGSDEVKVVLTDAKGKTLDSCNLFALSKKNGSIRRFSNVSSSRGLKLGHYSKLVTD